MRAISLTGVGFFVCIRFLSAYFVFQVPVTDDFEIEL